MPMTSAAMRLWGTVLCALALVAAPLVAGGVTVPPPADSDQAIAESLAEMVRDARTVISNNQDLINNPNIGDKHLTGAAVLADAVKLYQKNTGVDPRSIDKKTREGRLMGDMMTSIAQVVDDNQQTINEKGLGFKGFIPAVFGRLVSETFDGLAVGEAAMKITAPPDLVRNRKARPDAWETEVIKTKLLSPSWPKGQPYSAVVPINGHPAYRIAVPEYYRESCLACHGMPKGALDITGYPKEGRKLGDLGGVMSIVLLH
jgi:archaellum component FlaG (FlaF/FlaG flagellin family)